MINMYMPSVLNNPFLKEKVESIWMCYHMGEFRGHIEFKNGSSEGKQNFKGNSFEDIALQMKEFIDALTADSVPAVKK